MTKRQRSSAGRPSPRRAASRGLALGVLLLGLGACNDILGTGAPRVSSVSPAPGATSVPVNSSVVATLSLPGGAQLDVTTLTDTAVTLTDSSGAAVAGLRTPQGDTIVFDPTTDLAVDESYTFNVTADVKTSTNVALQPFSSSFSTGDSVAPPPGGLTADRTPVVFTAGGATSSDTRTLTLTNGGTDAVNVTGLTISGTDAAQFALADSAPSTLAPGQTRTLSLTFTPDGLGPQLATLTVANSGGASLEVPLGGLGVKGQGGGNEPSLQYILDTYGLGIETGDEDPSTIGITDEDSNGPVGEAEVAGEFYRKADPAQPVTVQVLAAFGVDNTPVTEFGYKATGAGGAQTEVLSLSGEPGLNEQRLNPAVTPTSGTASSNGTVTFEPGTGEFGLYSFWPGNQFFDERTVYSESALNTFPNAIPLHVRTYPLPGEANAYVVATEEFNRTSSGAENDYNDIVVIIRNVVPGGEFPEVEVPIPPAPVTPPASGIPGLSVRNTLGLPYPDRLVLQTIASTTGGNTCDPADTACDPNKWTGIEFPTTGTVTLQNTGAAPLQLSLSIQNDNLFVIGGSSSLTLQPGGSYDVPITFAPEGLTTKGVYPAGLVVQSGAQSAGVELRGLFMRRPEGSREVYFAPLVNDLFGYATDLGEIGNGGLQSPEPDSPLAGEEVRSALWEAANPASPVTALQLAAFYPCCTGVSGGSYSLALDQGGSNVSTMRPSGNDLQSILPRNSKGELTQLSANPTGPFSLEIAGYTTLDVGKRNLGVRLWPVRNRSGALIANTYLVAQDFVRDGCNGFGAPDTGSARAQNSELQNPEMWSLEPTQAGIGSNCDYQDNLYLIQNVQPAN